MVSVKVMTWPSSTATDTAPMMRELIKQPLVQPFQMP